jgi:malonyl-CoA/methylmalonyl-CoA synthetase
MGVPTYYTRLLASKELSKDRCMKMRLFISGSAPLLEETFFDFEKTTGHQILERYGMSETNMNTSNPVQGQRKPGTVGPPLPGVEVRIVDDNGEELEKNSIGNLLVKGPNVFKGYWKMPEKTLEDFTEDSFFKTGDKAKIDDDGYVSIVGRSKDMIITGGLNVYPKEVELVLDEINGVSESAVIGVSHLDFGEAVVAVVVRNSSSIEPDENEIISSAKDQLAKYKLPKRVIFVDQLPRNTMSKVQKNILRDNYKNLFS